MKTVPKEIGTFKTRDGAELYYEIRGQGEPVVFVYGIACLLNHWHHQLHYFSSDMRVYAYDMRGHHQSTAGDPAKCTVKGMGEDLAELLEHWNLDQVHLVGHSFGVPVLFETYNLVPDRIKSLAFINGFAQNPIKGMFGLDVVEPFFHFAKNMYEKNPEFFRAAWKAAVDNPLSIFMSGLAGGFNLQLTQFKDIEVYARGVGQLDLSVFIPLFENMMSFDGRKIAENVSVPTLVLAGDRDFVTPYKFQEDMHRLIRTSELVRLPYGSHCCQLDFPDYVNLRLEKHFQGRFLK